MSVSFKRDGVELSRHSFHPLEPLASAWKHRQLIAHLARRDILSRYRGSFMGLIWSFVQPLLMLAIYTVVLGYFLKSKWPGVDNSLEYSLVLFSGLILFNFLVECISRAPTLVLANPNYVRKIVFPLEVLPWVSVAAALFHTVLTLAAWIVFYLLVHHSLHWTIVYVPLLLIPLTFVAAALGWFLSATGVFIRDVNQLIPPITQALMFLSPLFYPVHDVPPLFRKILLANPLSFVIEQARVIMIWGHAPDFAGLGVYWIASLVAAWLAFVWFQYVRDGFGDVI
ncbi:MAG TPA: ABC transporter permease [Tepidisphaeraceae bacterium]|nr:ABC transporter permease [Tepidisphaeraceae bacterium]